MAAAADAAPTPAVVLLVEDDLGVRQAISDSLGDEGYSVVAVENGREALDWLRGGGQPCMILLDLFMPVMSGEEFRAEQLRHSVCPDVPVVIVTAALDGAARAQALGANGWLRKPLSLDRLLAVVAEHCAASGCS
jgi:CheY-like chemotaxis protein